ncbi:MULTISPECIES: hypothetical protein [Enterobacterales]|uniref:hypothetical protein n=1 Tax=Enterobacterales TaxID=91347 RepID=UPI0013D732CA|nr:MULTISPECIES: hypothetical protein [Enterobacteriaceae]
MASVTFKKINKVYDGKVQALKDIELKINAQDFLVIVSIGRINAVFLQVQPL